MGLFVHYFRASWISIRRAPLPYALTIFIVSLGLGVFFTNATFYYWIQHDPLPGKSEKLFFPRIASYPWDCGQCEAPMVLSYRDVKKLSSSGIPSAMNAMFRSEAYVRLTEQHQATAASIRATQRDFFKMFDAPILSGQVWADDSARMEVVLARAFAEKIFGRADVVGQTLLLDDQVFQVVAVLDYWQMLPRLYDAVDGGYLKSVEDIYLPLETAYDLDYPTYGQSQSFESINPKRLATEGREKALHRLQFWVQLDTAEQQLNYKQFMKNLVADERKAGRHPSADFNRLHPMSGIMEDLHLQPAEMKAYALVAALFLFVCMFNASHLSLNRYIANQYEFSLRRALGASRQQLQLQMLADVLLSSVFSTGLAIAIASLGIILMDYLLPGNSLGVKWSGALFLWMFFLTISSNYMISLYPVMRTSFGNINQQLKS